MRSCLTAAAAICATLASFAASAQGAAPAREQVPGGSLMLAAYIVIWAAPLYLIWRSHSRITDLEARTREMEALLEGAALSADTTDPA